MHHNHKKIIRHVQSAILSLIILNKKQNHSNAVINIVAIAGQDILLIKLKVMDQHVCSQNVHNSDAI
jgi:hypothetical protein